MTRVNLGPARSVDMKGAKGVIRGETWREERNSWGGGEDGDGSACVAGDADGFEVGHFGCRIRCRAGDGSFEKGDAVGRFLRKILGQTAIGLENDSRETCSDRGGKDAHGYICGGRQVCGFQRVGEKGNSLGKDDPGADHRCRGGRVGRIPRDDCHRAIFIGLA